MLTLRRIEISDFAMLNDIDIEPSTDPERPLTVIRGDNAAGKTTLLRAIRWCMYGDKGLPGVAAAFSLHPVWWDPRDPGVETEVSIEFDADSSDVNTSGAQDQFRYRLTRKVVTIGKPSAPANEPDFHRIEERPTLMVKPLGGTWGLPNPHPDPVIDMLLPLELRDFFLMDADEAVALVGGSDENKVAPKSEYREKTTEAISGLLGLDLFTDASNRVKNIGQNFSRKASKATGDKNLNQLEEDLDRTREALDRAYKKQEAKEEERETLSDDLQQRRSTLANDIRQAVERDEWADRLEKVDEELDLATEDRTRHLAYLSEDLESTELLAGLASTAISQTQDFLRPLHKQGHIPSRHVPFVRELLNEQRCVCGQDLSRGTAHRQRVEKHLADAAEEETKADHLYQLYEASLRLENSSSASSWKEKRARHEAELAACVERFSACKREKKDLSNKLRDIEDAKIDTSLSQIESLETQLDVAKANLVELSYEIKEMEDKKRSLKSTVDQRQRNKQAARDYRAASDLSQRVVVIIENAYVAVEERQVKELSERMNRLFFQMATDASDGDLQELPPGKSSLHMIAEVGVRSVANRARQFEIYAKNVRGRNMPMTEINGASRRVISLSFVLGLCDVSNTEAPFIADSLLNVMSGRVRSNTLRITTERSRQPILLLLYGDLEDPTDAATAMKKAGATYTLTPFRKAPQGKFSGHAASSSNRLLSALCRCGPREYCNTCEITHEQGAGWTRRRN